MEFAQITSSACDQIDLFIWKKNYVCIWATPITLLDVCLPDNIPLAAQLSGRTRKVIDPIHEACDIVIFKISSRFGSFRIPLSTAIMTVVIVIIILTLIDIIFFTITTIICEYFYEEQVVVMVHIRVIRSLWFHDDDRVIVTNSIELTCGRIRRMRFIRFSSELTLNVGETIFEAILVGLFQQVFYACTCKIIYFFEFVSFIWEHKNHSLNNEHNLEKISEKNLWLIFFFEFLNENWCLVHFE